MMSTRCLKKGCLKYQAAVIQGEYVMKQYSPDVELLVQGFTNCPTREDRTSKLGMSA